MSATNIDFSIKEDIMEELSVNDALFLRKIYNIVDYDSGMLYIKNNESSKNITIMRIIVLMFKVYGKDNYFPSQEFVDYVHKYIKCVNDGHKINKLKPPIDDELITTENILSELLIYKEKIIQDPAYGKIPTNNFFKVFFDKMSKNNK